MTGGESHPSAEMTLKKLWREFLPLSLSDVAMACGDPLVSTTVAHLPDARANLGAIGVAKALAVFFESPIIMILHASNALAGSEKSRRALWRFVLLAGLALTSLLAVVAIPQVFSWIGVQVLGVNAALMEKARLVLTVLVLWPGLIAVRRYFQGLLIHGGHTKRVGKASVMRLLAVVAILAVGFAYQLRGEVLAGGALLGGLLVETILVIWAVARLGPLGETVVQSGGSRQPTTLKGVVRFYWPLANSMVVVWGGRALLLTVIARAADSTLALAAWPAAWGIVLVIANATRMVQQVVIRNRSKASFGLLLKFTLSVGLCFTIVLLAMALTPWGRSLLNAFIGGDLALLASIQPVIFVCSLTPLLVAVQNACQGFLIGDGRTGSVNVATWVSTALLLSVSTIAIHLGMAGASAAALAMIVALSSETLWLGGALAKKKKMAGIAELS